MTKAELAGRVNERVGFSRADAVEMVETALEIIKETPAQGENVKISGFGNFVVRSKRERLGRNPHTTQPIIITARKVVTFKASSILKKTVKAGQPAVSSS